MHPRLRLAVAIAAFAAIDLPVAHSADSASVLAPPSLKVAARADRASSLHRTGKRELRQRTLTVTDNRPGPIPELHVAAEAATAIAFPSPLRKDGVLLSDRHDAFLPARIIDRVLVLLA